MIAIKRLESVLPTYFSPTCCSLSGGLNATWSYVHERDGSLMLFHYYGQATDFVLEHGIDPHSDWVEYEEVSNGNATR